MRRLLIILIALVLVSVPVVGVSATEQRIALVIGNANGLTNAEAKAVVDLFFDEMADALSSGERVEIRGLCSFHVRKYPGYTGRNPRTGGKVQVRPKKLPLFKAGKELKERVNK